MNGFRIEPLAEPDAAALLHLNNACVPHVNELDEAALNALMRVAAVLRGAFRDGILAGAVLALGPGLEYASPNYRWFARRYRQFLYVDRVLVDEPYRRLGLGRLLYEDLFARAPVDAANVLCEVNLEPPNPGSLTFHRRLGFRDVGRQRHASIGKTVLMLARPLNAGGSQS